MSRRHHLGAALALVGVLAASGCSGNAALPPEVSGVAPTTAAPGTTVAVAPCASEDGATASYPSLSPLPASTALPKGSFEAEIQGRKLKVGVSADTLLFGSRNPLTGQLEGFDNDILREVAKAIFGADDKNVDDHIEYHVIRYDQRIPLLRDGTVDIVAHTMTITCKRWKQIAFSTEYYHAGQKVLVKKNSGYRTIGDVVAAGVKVCAPAGSTNLDELQKPQYAGIQLVTKPDVTDCLVAMQQGEADAASGDDTVLAGLAAQDPTTVVVGKNDNGDAFTDEPYGLGIASQHVDFVRYVNAVLDQLRSNGRWKELFDKWLAATLPAQSPPTPDTSRPLP